MADIRASDVPDAAERDRYVFTEWVRCPVCNSRNVRTKKTRPEEPDESVTRETVCRDCGWDFLVVVE
jgi:hypothetical protein